jgi:hypothetical protein
MKIKVYGIEIAVFGSDRKHILYFKSSEEREEYASLTPNPYSLLSAKKIEETALTPYVDDWNGEIIYRGAYELI